MHNNVVMAEWLRQGTSKMHNNLLSNDIFGGTQNAQIRPPQNSESCTLQNNLRWHSGYF